MESYVPVAEYNSVINRALKAEKAFLSLRKELNVDRLRADMTTAEREYQNKLQIYSAVPEHKRRIDEDFKRESSRLLERILQAEKIYDQCIIGLDRGLSLDDLPLTTESSVDVERIISDKLAAKAYSSGLTSYGDNYSMVNGDSTAASVNYGKIESNNSNTNSLTSYLGNDGMFRSNTSTMPEIKDWRDEHAKSPVGGFFNTDMAGNHLSGLAVQAPARSLPSDVKPYVSSDVTSSTVSSAAVWGNQHDTFYLDDIETDDIMGDSSLYGGRMQALSLDSMVSPLASATVTESSTNYSAMNKLMSPKPSPPSTVTSAPPAVSTNSMAAIAATTSTKAATSPTESDASANKSSPSSKLTAPAGKAQPAAPGAAGQSKATQNSSKDAASSRHVDWGKEAFRSILIELVKKHKKMTAKAIKETFEKVALDIGLSDINSVYKETERRIDIVLKPEQHLEASSATSTAVPPVPGRIDKTKTVLCMHWTRDGYCHSGDKCTFAHGIEELRIITYPTPPPAPAASQTATTFNRNPMYNMLCKFYSFNKKCPHGDSCYYAHGEEELVAKPVQQAHEEPCNDQRCPGRIKFLLQKTSICPRFAIGQCQFGAGCRFAHSEAELKPMPKTEMCVEYMKGTCMYYECPERCVYAHGEKDLNKKVDSPTEDIDRCMICKRALTYKKSILSCKHDNFHESCLKEKMKKGVIICPICNKHTRYR